MAANSPNTTPMLFILACFAVCAPTGLAQQPRLPGLPPFSRSFAGQISQCWSSLENIPGCVAEIYISFVNGRFGIIGPVCCEVTKEIKSDCWPNMFPFNPAFPRLLTNSCGQSDGTILPPKGFGRAIVNKLSFSGLSPLKPENDDVPQCLSSLANMQGCLLEILGSLLRGLSGSISPPCCEAISEINDSCWLGFIPFNPFFPPLLDHYCASSGTAAPPPQGAGQKKLNMNSLPGLFSVSEISPGLSGKDTEQCWSSLTRVEGCTSEIYGSLSSGKFGVTGPACCNAITEVNDTCWPNMFPLNPLFPPLLKSNCAIREEVPTAKGL